eukprot:NODE_291_length_10603_cov_1.029703.p1 type:complete len:770 gc:universal NODE_291_length_10603_cov_1.029703:4435-6744(+)
MRAISILEILMMNLQFFSITFSLHIVWPDTFKGFFQFLNFFRLDLSWIIIDDMINDDRSYYMIICIVVPLILIASMIILFRDNLENIVYTIAMFSIGGYIYNREYPNDVSVYGTKKVFLKDDLLSNTHASMTTTLLIGVVISSGFAIYQLRRLYRLLRSEIKTKSEETDQLAGNNSSIVTVKSMRKQIVNFGTWIFLIVVYTNIDLPSYIQTFIILFILFLSYLMITSFNLKYKSKTFHVPVLDKMNAINSKIGDKIRGIALQLIILCFGFVYIPVSEYSLRMFRCASANKDGFYMPKSVKMNLKDIIFSTTQVHTPLIACGNITANICTPKAYNLTCSGYHGNLLENMRLESQPELDCDLESSPFQIPAILTIIAVTFFFPFLYYVLIHMAVNIIKAVKADAEEIDPWNVKMERITTSASALFSMFKYKTRYTKILYLLQRLLLVVIAVFCDLSYSPFLLLVVHLIALVCYAIFRPYREMFENALAVSLSVAQSINLTFAAIASRGGVSNALLILAAIIIAFAPIVSIVYHFYDKRKKKKLNTKPPEPKKTFKQWLLVQFGADTQNENVEGLAVTRKELKNYMQISNRRLLGVLNNFFLLLSALLIAALGVSLGNFFHYFREAVRTDLIFANYTMTSTFMTQANYMPFVLNRAFPQASVDLKIKQSEIARNVTYNGYFGHYATGTWRQGCCCTVETESFVNNSITVNMTYERWNCAYQEQNSGFGWINVNKSAAIAFIDNGSADLRQVVFEVVYINVETFAIYECITA